MVWIRGSDFFAHNWNRRCNTNGIYDIPAAHTEGTENPYSILSRCRIRRHLKKRVEQRRKPQNNWRVLQLNSKKLRLCLMKNCLLLLSLWNKQAGSSSALTPLYHHALEVLVGNLKSWGRV